MLGSVFGTNPISRPAAGGVVALFHAGVCGKVPAVGVRERRQGDDGATTVEG